jgi:hypothetical protein
MVRVDRGLKTLGLMTHGSPCNLNRDKRRNIYKRSAYQIDDTYLEYPQTIFKRINVSKFIFNLCDVSHKYMVRVDRGLKTLGLMTHGSPCNYVNYVH